MMVVVNELHCLTSLRLVTVGFTVLLSNVNPKSVGGGQWEVRPNRTASNFEWRTADWATSASGEDIFEGGF